MRIQAVLRYSKSDGDKADAVEELETLQGDLENVRKRLDVAASLLSDTVVSHSRFQDSVRSVQRLQVMVATIAREAEGTARRSAG